MNTNANGTERDYIQSLERGMQVLQAFAASEATPSASELAAKLNLSRPAIRRILLTFEKLGFAQQHKGEWSLTPRILEISQGYFTSNSLPELAQPFLMSIAEKTSESTSVSVLDGTEVVHVARVEVRRIMQHAIRVGSRLPAHATSMGRVLLGALDPTELDEYFASTNLEAYTPATITDEKTLRAAIDRDRARGYSLAVEELEPGMIAVAVPITTPSGSVIGTLSSTSTPMRSSPEKLTDDVLPLLLEVAADISRAYYLSNKDRFLHS